MKALRLLVLAVGILSLAGCEKSLDEQMNEYIAFYYPTSGEYAYDIQFDWGSYLIFTHAKPDEAVHPDSAKYRGYITMRPHVAKPAEGLAPLFYLVTPEGKVWTIAGTTPIPELAKREEVTVERNGSVTSTTTTTIESPSEPVIDHFLSHRDLWTEYGALTKDGDQYALALAAK